MLVIHVSHMLVIICWSSVIKTGAAVAAAAAAPGQWALPPTQSMHRHVQGCQAASPFTARACVGVGVPHQLPATHVCVCVCGGGGSACL